ncbi:cutinase family protein [Nocardia farcinica]|uniref:cutinase family protein n=1 Tax=Nocardia farcinica TaxID=37329 RepID=UPI001894F8BE|nr:cutinase family protein [Nocardia farcinica]MBF6268919.1 cutinase family protein [Nocardia farcinica]MCZ9326239.1 cutinase family protein [Nocardia farcinica]
MALREFFVRHRIAPAVVAPAVLGLAAVVAASWALTSPSSTVDTELKASVTECHDMVSISVAGRNDTPREGSTLMLVDANGNPLPAALSGDHNSEWLNPVVNAPADDVDPGSYAAVYIAYPANMATYEDAVNAGVANTQQVMREIAQACPDTRFAIVGYSEGADVVRRVAMGIGHDEAGADGTYAVVDPTQVVGVVILADAGRSAGDGPFPGAEDPFANPDGFDQQYQNGNTPVPGQGALPGTSGDFGALNGKIASFCSDGDLTCAAPQNISLLQLVVNVGRQLDVDRLEREGLTPATGGDVAAVLGQIAMAAFADIAAQPNWMASDETFLEVLLRVSDPEYKPGETPREPARADAIAAEEMSPLAYLPQKLFNEVIGLLVTNQNTIPVILSDPYNLTLGPNHSGHHFDYWDDADPSAGKPLTSAEYAAAWLTHLAKQAQAGVPLNTTTKPAPAELAAAYEEVEATVAATTTGAPSTAAPSTTVPTTAAPTTTVAPTTTGAAPTTTGNSTAPTTNAPATTVDPKTAAPTTAAPTTAAAPMPTTDAAATQPSVPVAPTTTTPAPSGR